MRTRKMKAVEDIFIHGAEIMEHFQANKYRLLELDRQLSSTYVTGSILDQYDVPVATDLLRSRSAERRIQVVTASSTPMASPVKLVKRHGASATSAIDVWRNDGFHSLNLTCVPDDMSGLIKRPFAELLTLGAV
jgi:hypothetical protein